MKHNIQVSVVIFELVSLLSIIIELFLSSIFVNNYIFYFAGLICLLQIAFISWNHRSNPLLFAVSFFILYFVYSVVVKVYFCIDDLPFIFQYTSVSKNELIQDALIVQVFFCIYAFSINGEFNIDLHIFEKNMRSNKYIVWICSLYCIFSPFVFYRASNGFGVRGSISSPLYEYTCLFLLIGLIYSGRKSNNLILLVISSGFWCLHGFIYGERAPALTAIIIWGCYLFFPKITSKRILIYSLIGVVVFTIIGSFRGLSFFSIEGLQSVLRSILKEKFASDTAYYSYQAGNAIARFEHFNSIWDRIGYAVGYLFYIFKGGSSKAGNLANVVQKHPGTFHQGGGWIMFYSHFWGGMFGVIIFGFYIVFLFWKIFNISDSKNYFKNYLALYITASVPRWFLYSPAPITRSIFVFSMLYFLFNIIYKLTLKKF